LLGPVSDDVIGDAYRRTKYGRFGRLRKKSSSITVRKGVRSATQLVLK
jgi:hypothetical protein